MLRLRVSYLRTTIGAGALAIALAVSATPAIADPAAATAPSADTAAVPAVEADAAPQGGLDEIVVTASKRSESIQRTPIAVTAIGGDSIEQNRISTFRDIAGRIPGLVAPRQSSAQTTQTYSMRGIGEPDTFPEPTVAVYVDDVYLGRTVGSLYDTPDLERVEVLRGPQGTLYGRNSSAGAIRFITKEPTSDPSLYVSAAYGSYDNVEVKARLNGPILADDKLNGSISVDRHVRDGWMYDIPLDTHVNDLDLWVVRGKLKSQLTERLSATLSGDVMFDRSSQSFYAPVNQPNGQTGTGKKTNPNITWAESGPFNKTNAYGTAFTLQYEIDDHLKLKSVSAWRGFDGPIYYDNDGVTAIKADSYGGFIQKQLSEEINLNGEWDRFNFVVGAYYFNENFWNDRFGQSATSNIDNIGLISAYTNRLKTKSYSIFGQANYKLSDIFTVTVGGRYVTDRRDFTATFASRANTQLIEPYLWDYDPRVFEQRYGAFTNRVSVAPPIKTFKNFTPKLGLQAQWSKDIFQYVSYSKGFKSGGYDLRSSTVAGATNPYRPQLVTAYETGVKTRFLDGAFTANLAIFYNDVKDLQLRATSPATPTSLGFSGVINAASGSTKGGELELAAAPTDRLRLGATAAFLKTRYKTFTAILPANVAGRTTLVGLDYPLSPKWQLSGNFDWRLPIPGPGAWRILGDVSYESRRYFDLYNTPQAKQGPQKFVNGTVSYTTEEGSLTAGLQATNLFNAQYDQRTTYIPANSGQYPNYARAYNNPRMVNFFITKQF
jgi:iron complex outermembrane receptor protein